MSLADMLARWAYEAYDSHFSMPGGLSWDEYKQDDPDGAEGVHLAPAREQAAVVAEWLRSDEVVGVVAEAIDRNVEAEDYLPVYPRDGSRCVDSGAARAALAALVAHAKGEGQCCGCYDGACCQTLSARDARDG